MVFRALATFFADTVLGAAIDANVFISVLVVACYVAVVIAAAARVDSLFLKMVVSKLEERVSLFYTERKKSLLSLERGESVSLLYREERVSLSLSLSLSLF